jgi:hypothetical protein
MHPHQNESDSLAKDPVHTTWRSAGLRRMMPLMPLDAALRLACPLFVLLDSLTFQEKKCEVGSPPLLSSP